jgi:acetoin utilization protein AcuC
VAIAEHRPLDPASEVPGGWRDYVRERVGRPGPGRFTDGRDAQYVPWSRGHDPADAVDRAVMATRRAVFPLHGLDPWFD